MAIRQRLRLGRIRLESSPVTDSVEQTGLGLGDTEQQVKDGTENKSPKPARRKAGNTKELRTTPTSSKPSEADAADRKTELPHVLAPVLDHETLLPVSGTVRFSTREARIINHPAFQRLFGIYQLGQTHVVYRGATHTRGEHAVGTLSAAADMIGAIARNSGDASAPTSEHWERGPALTFSEVAFVRLAALLHDVGHLPAGHTLEDELGLLPPHDSRKRISQILRRADWFGKTHTPLLEVIDSEYAPEAAEADLRDPDNGSPRTASEILMLLIAKDPPKLDPIAQSRFRVGVCRDLVGNTICADLLDYLHRDWLHIGKPRHFDPRLLDYLEIRTRLDPATSHPQHRLVINLRGGSRPRPDAVSGILELLESRYQLSEIALFHRVKLSAAGMLERAIAEYRDSFPIASEQDEALVRLVPDLLEVSDGEMLKLLEDRLNKRRELVKGDTQSRIKGAIDLLQRLQIRDLHKDLRIFYEDDVNGHARAELIANRFAGDPTVTSKPLSAEAVTERRRAAKERLLALRRLEADFGLPTGSIVMYCPDIKMTMKIAEVGIYVDDLVDTLANLDRGDPRISGGHLTAQQVRFRRLWRIAFAIEARARDRLVQGDLLSSLVEVIRRAVLRITPEDGGTYVRAMEAVAKLMIVNRASPFYGRTLVDPSLNRAQATLFYPGGVPSLASFIGN